MSFRKAATSGEVGSRYTPTYVLLLALLLIPGCGLLTAESLKKGDAGEKNKSSDQPNIVFILTDDMRKDELEHMPKTKKLLQEQGTTFDNTFVSYSLCCPARATFLTGKYTHNHHVLTNAPGDRGGEKRFRELGGDESTIATWLNKAGYTTAHVGKYMNGYSDTYIPPGWDEWYTLVGAYHINQRINSNGEIKDHDVSSLEDVLWQKIEGFLSRSAGSAEPFYLQVNTHAPHEPPSFPPTYSDKFPNVRAPRPPSFSEKEISDKPMWVRAQNWISKEEQRDIDEMYRDRLRSLAVVDDVVAWTVQSLRETGELDNTYIFFTSDNGFHLGEHRIKAGKWTPYEEAIRIPLVVRGPGVPSDEYREEMVINNDFAPTFAEIGGARSPEVDGRSFLPLLRGESVPWRKRFLIESWHANLPSSPPTYQAVRTQDMLYTEYEADPVEQELYDLNKDPHELQNIHQTADPDLVNKLKSELTDLVRCKGAECRAAEDR